MLVGEVQADRGPEGVAGEAERVLHQLHQRRCRRGRRDSRQTVLGEAVQRGQRVPVRTDQVVVLVIAVQAPHNRGGEIQRPVTIRPSTGPRDPGQTPQNGETGGTPALAFYNEPPFEVLPDPDIRPLFEPAEQPLDEHAGTTRMILHRPPIDHRAVKHRRAPHVRICRRWRDCSPLPSRSVCRFGQRDRRLVRARADGRGPAKRWSGSGRTGEQADTSAEFELTPSPMR
jgi:hypothetical protein